METETNEKKLKYNEIPKQVSRKDFNKYINPRRDNYMSHSDKDDYITFLINKIDEFQSAQTTTKQQGHPLITGI